MATHNKASRCPWSTVLLALGTFGPLNLGARRPAWLELALAASLGMFLTGCSTSKAARAKPDAAARWFSGFRQQGQVFLQASPHARLYVEVDAVEGCTPPENDLNELKDFLGRHCTKPDGVELVRSDVIPRERARGMMPSALARQYLNGPPESVAGGTAAFIYLLCYDDVLCDRPVVTETGHVGAREAARPRLVNRNPHVDMAPYPAMIYMNTRWHPKRLHVEALRHEAGHVLGLAFRSTNALAGHCLSRSCLMSASAHFVRMWLGLDQKQLEPLCEDCLAQLAESQTRPPLSNLKFVGPVLVRSETGYQVLALPHRGKVVLGDLSERECHDFAAAFRAEEPKPDEHETSWHFDASGTDRLPLDLGRTRELIDRIQADPDPMVPRLAPVLWTIAAARFAGAKQYGDAIEACRQAIRRGGADGQAHNLLAWIHATCPDPALRNSAEAVRAATHACDLSRWKESNWIDTLAAAWAESGDFKRAIQFEELALRTSPPQASVQAEMRQRLSLYLRGQPFHEAP